MPKVSVICLCYNQAPYLKTAFQSIQDQTYQNLETILVDDGSTDGSDQIIRELKAVHPELLTLISEKNLGNCSAFNKAFQLSSGDFIIDLAADDVLMPDRVKSGVEDFFAADKQVGVLYSDAWLIDEKGNEIGRHSKQVETSPEGNIYKHLITSYFINPVSMMMKREVLVQLGGYDEALTYEDFDFWIRSSRNWKYKYNPRALVKKRVVRRSLSKSQKQLFNKHQQSTYQVCRKIRDLNRTQDENDVLKSRIRYEMKQCLLAGNLNLIVQYQKLLNQL